MALSYETLLAASAPTSAYHFGEASGTTFTDYIDSHNGTSGTTPVSGYPVSGVTYSQASFVNSVTTTSVLLDGVAGWAAPDPFLATDGGTAVTYNVWIKLPAIPKNATMYVMGDDDTANTVTGQSFTINPVTGACAAAFGNGTIASVAPFLYSFVPNGVYMLSMSYDGANVRVYVNGQQQASAPMTGVVGGSAQGPHFGINPITNAQYANLYFQQAAIWTGTTVSAANLLALYQAGSPGVSTTLVSAPIVHQQLSLTAYLKFGGGSPATQTFYANQITDLSFSTIAPGGFGDLKCRLLVPDTRQVPPELSMFANIALMDGPFACFLGRWDEPALGLDTSAGTVFELVAQGAATNLKDDPIDTSYINQTALQIIQNQYTAGSPSRSNYLLLDSDTSAVLPNNPSYQFTESFAGATIEDVLNKLTPILGDYQWGVWGHPRNKDIAGFPTWQLQYHQRDASTTAYIALPEDIETYKVRPTGEYSYNVVTIAYKDATSGLPSSVTVYDSRLTASYVQNAAPFPMRRLRKDLGSVTLSATQATAIANALLSDYQNGGFKIEVVLTQVRNPSGVPLPLWQVQADHNISIPSISVAGNNALPFAPKANVNQYYIVETRYQESSNTAPKLTITANANTDTASFQIARLQYQANQATQNAKTLGIIQAPGAVERGKCGMDFVSGGAAQVWGHGVNFKTTLSAAPSSITFSATSSTNVTGVSATNITATGFNMLITATAAGAAAWHGDYITVT